MISLVSSLLTLNLSGAVFLLLLLLCIVLFSTLIKYLSAEKVSIFNPLSANPTKWSNTLKQLVGKTQRIV